LSAVADKLEAWRERVAELRKAAQFSDDEAMKRLLAEVGLEGVVSPEALRGCAIEPLVVAVARIRPVRGAVAALRRGFYANLRGGIANKDEAISLWKKAAGKIIEFTNRKMQEWGADAGDVLARAFLCIVKASKEGQVYLYPAKVFCEFLRVSDRATAEASIA